MEQVHFPYSTKCIPRCSKQEYMKALITRTEDFIKRLRWKAFFFLNELQPDSDPTPRETFGFRTPNTPPPILQLRSFENDLYKLLSSIKFRHQPNDFLDKLDEDVHRIKSSPMVLVPSDKTGNFYKLSVQEYRGLIDKSITADYRKSSADSVTTINKAAAPIAARLGLSGRMEEMEQSKAFVLLKDHKDNFSSNKPCRLINPAKSDIGKVSKVLLDRINTSIRSQRDLNQWRSTAAVIDWFVATRSTSKALFITFDIESFYPSITEPLLDRAMAWAHSIVPIPPDDIEVIKQARKTLLFSPTGEAWERKNSTNRFDVTMGAPDGAEVCELVGLYLLHLLSSFIPASHTGLYRDDGLILLENVSKPGVERIRKDLFQEFSNEGLKITVSPPLTSVDFLDVNFRTDGSYRPFRKPEKRTEYVHRSSNHPPNILSNIPEMINHRVNSISSSKEVFDAAKGFYEDALTRSGRPNPSLSYQDTPPSQGRKRNRKRKIIWFNPPYSVTVETDVGKRFLNLIRLHFPTNHPLHKIVNPNTVKLSYSCMKNMERIIKGHNRKLLDQHVTPPDTGPPKTCNCRDPEKNPCPLGGACLQKEVIYLAKLKSGDNEEHQYVGLASTTFKQRYYKHTYSFRHEDQRGDTKLSDKVWDRKERGLSWSIDWGIIRKGHSYRVGQSSCDLCTSEKLEIINRSRDPRLLNSRTEILAKCRHKGQFLL